MKSEQFKFNSKTSAIRGKTEKEPVKNKRNWDKIIYLVILCGIVLALLYYLITSYYVVEGQGRVLTNQFTVRAPNDITLVEMHTEVGNELQIGDSLFSYNFVDNASGSDSLMKAREQKNDIQNDLFDVREDIVLKRQQLQSLQEKLQFYEQRKGQVEKQIKLNVETVNRLQNIEEEIVDLQADIKTANQELQLKYQRRNRIQGSINNIEIPGNIAASGENSNSNNKLYRSPYTGNITNIFKDPLELALKSEEIISIQRDSAKVLVKIIFDRDDARYLSNGTELAIRFDNGEPSRGIITDLYAAEADLLPIFNLTGIESSEKIVVELKPYNENIRQQWRSLNGVGLTASKTLF